MSKITTSNLIRMNLNKIINFHSTGEVEGKDRIAHPSHLQIAISISRRRLHKVNEITECKDKGNRVVYAFGLFEKVYENHQKPIYYYVSEKFRVLFFWEVSVEDMRDLRWKLHGWKWQLAGKLHVIPIC